jgi:ribulose-phosphate 3-epimerase
MISISPSILSADFSKLGEQVLETERAGAHRIHVDVMDGHFVPNLSMGPEVVRGLRPITKLPLEVHLMVEHPGRFIDYFVDAGADAFFFHLEVQSDPRPLLHIIRGWKKRAGLVINPDTPVEELEPYLAEVDMALLMTVFPGFSGQKFIKDSPQRIERLRALINKIHPSCELVDGGVNESTAHESVQAGANVLVMASAIFGHPEGPAAAVEKVRRKFNGG